MYLIASYLSLIRNDKWIHIFYKLLDTYHSCSALWFDYVVLFYLDTEQGLLVKAVKVHENYNKNNYHNDIALLQVEGSIKFGKHVEPICIPSQGYEFDTNVKCFAAGWGHKSWKGHSSREMLELEVSCLYQECFEVHIFYTVNQILNIFLFHLWWLV